MTEKTIKDRLSVKEIWIRLVLMVIYAIITYFILQPIVWIVAAFQFIYGIFVGKPNKTLMPFADGFSQYIGQIMAYLTYAADKAPFPFQAWPTSAEKPAAKKPAAKKAE